MSKITALTMAATVVLSVVLSASADDAMLGISSNVTANGCLDLRSGTLLAKESETITYSPQWGGAANCAINGMGGAQFTAASEGETTWTPPGAGCHVLTHTAGGETYTARFFVPGADVAVMEGGRLSSSAVWTSDKTWLVTGDYVVASNATLTIESGTVVKFMPGASLTVEAGGACIAAGVTFTHVGDDTDTVGGDTLGDGDAMTPAMGEYAIWGDITDDATTQYRYLKFAFGVGGAFGATGGLDLRNGTLLAKESETITYSPQWGGAANCAIDGMGGSQFTAASEGETTWTPSGAGCHVLTHTAGGETYTARFFVPGADVAVIEVGQLLSNATWSSDKTWLVTGDYVVASNVTLSIESGTVVKFMPGASLTVEAGGACIAAGVTFTHVGDDTDTVGGDTLGDGDAMTPAMGEYAITGEITDDATTQYRYLKFAFGVGGAFGATGGLDLRDGARLAKESEPLTYSPRWGNAAECSVAVDGNQAMAAAEEGSYDWYPASTGLHVLTHKAGEETLTAEFFALGEEAVAIERSRLLSDTIWSADKVWVIGDDVTVASNVTLTIESGTVVKFLNDKKITIEPGGLCVAEGVIFTSVYDDTVGGDTPRDGDATAPAENSYTIAGFIKDSFSTEYRYGMQSYSGVLFGNVTWRKERTYIIDGMLTVADGAFLTIQPETVVKFADDSSLAVASGGTCIAAGVIFTHIADDTVGDDTMGDGDETKPEYGKYTIDTAVIDDETTQYRYSAPILASGTITDNVVWRARQVYQVTGNLTLASGATLTIVPGTIIKFDAGISLTINSGATLYAQGTRSRPVVFTSIKDDEHGGDTNGDGDDSVARVGDWRQIRVAGGTFKAVYTKLLYCSDDNNQGGLYVTGGNVTLDGCHIAHCKYDCMRSTGGKSVVRNSIFEDASIGVAPNGGPAEYYHCVFSGLTTAVRWSYGTFVNCIFTDVSEMFFDSTKAATIRNCVMWNPVGVGPQSLSEVGRNGSIWADPKFEDAEKGDYRIKADSPCVDAGDGTVAPVKDYYNQPRFGVPDIGIYEVQPREAKSDVDLVAVSVVCGEMAKVGGNITVSWTVANEGTAATDVLWRDVLELIDSSGRIVELSPRLSSNPLAPDGRYTQTRTFAVPALEPGEARLRLRVNPDRDIYEGAQTDNNIAYAEGAVMIDLPGLDELEDGRLLAIPPRASVAVRLPAGGNDMVSLRIKAGENVSAYAAAGFVPVALKNDVVAVRLADGTLFLSLPSSPDKDVFVTFENDFDISAKIEIERVEGAASVLDVLPNELAVSETSRLVLTGIGLKDVIAVSLAGPGTVAAESIELLSSAELAAAFRLTGAAEGNYDVVLSLSSGEEVRVNGAVKVFAPRMGAKLNARLDVPGSIRLGRVYSGRIIISNDGDSPMDVPYLVLNGGGASLRLAGETEWNGGELKLLGTTSAYPAGVLDPGEVEYIEFEFTARSQPRFSLKVENDATDGWQADRSLLAGAATRLGRLGRIERRVSELEAITEASGALAGGQIVDAVTGAPLSGVGVATMGLDGGSFGGAVSDVNGVFVIDGITQGKCVVFYASEGVDANAYVAMIPQEGDFAGIKLMGTIKGASSGEDAVQDEVAGVDACGKVEDVAGAGISNAVVTLLAIDDVTNRKSVFSAEDGSFVFTNVVDGTYLLHATCSGYQDDAPRILSVSGVNAEAGSIVLVAYTNALAGVIRNAPEGAAVGLVMEDTSETYSTPLGEDGGFEIKSLPEGLCRIILFGADGSVIQVERDVRIRPGENELNITAKEAGVRYIRAKAVEQGLTNVALYASWTFVSDADDGKSATTRDDGFAYLTLREAEYIVNVYAPGYREVSFRIAISDNRDIMVELEKDDHGDDGEGTTSDDGDDDPDDPQAATVIITGRVKGDGRTYSGGKVTLYTNDVAVCTTFLAATGAFMFPDAPVEFDTILVELADGMIFDCTKSEAENAGWILNVPDKEEIGIVQTQVLDPNGKPLPNVTVQFTTLQGYSVVRKTNSRGKTEIFQTKDKGKVTIKVLPDTTTDVAPPPVETEPETPSWCPKCGAFPCRCSAQETPDVKACPSCGQSPCVCSPKVINETQNETTGQIEDNPFVQEELDSLIDQEIWEDWINEEILPATWSAIDYSWVRRYESRIESLYRKLSTISKERNPEYVTCASKGCTYNERVWREYLLRSTEANAACANASLLLTETVMESRRATGSMFGNGLATAISFTMPGPAGAILSSVAGIANGLFYGGVAGGVGASIEAGGTALIEGSANRVGARRLGKALGGTMGIGLAVSDITNTRAEMQGQMNKLYQAMSKASRTVALAAAAARRPYKECRLRDPNTKEKEVVSLTVPQSCDPNEVVGPAGVGEERFVKPGEWMTYTVYFENVSNATAAAQEVYVTNPLNEWLDWDTFEMGEVAFGNQVDLGLSGKKNGTSEATMNGTNFIVRTRILCDTNSGIAQWYLRIVDPVTKMGWPDNVIAGFLPPNDQETHCGEGRVSYRIKVRDDAPAGIVITNSATIVFDTNDPIETDPAWWNTVGQEISVTINDGEGNVVTNVFFIGAPYGDALPKAPAKDKPGYTFVGWFTDQNGSGRQITAESTVVAGDGGIYPNWTANTYEVAFHANGGEGEMANQTNTYDVASCLTSNAFTRTSHWFIGWATNETGAVVYEDGAEISNLTAVASGVVDLYAVWELITMEVSFGANGGVFVGDDGGGQGADRPTMVVTNGVAYGELPEVERTGYAFDGWANGRSDWSTVVTAETIVTNETDHTLYAQWVANEYTVRFNANDGEGTMGNQTFEFDQSDVLDTNVFVRIGYGFTGWATNETGEAVYADGAEVLNLAAENGAVIDLYAVWAATTAYAKFVEVGGVTDEGSNAVVRVYGGNAESASSVKVYLTYNTAAAADVDLAKGTVSSMGSLPVQEGNAQAARSTGLKFPLALSWEKGEVGEKVVTIPTKADKTVEGDEFFTLQLAEAEGMELGEERVCTVTIRDATVAAGKETLQDAVNNAVVKMSTSGKGKWAYANVGTGGEAAPGKTASASAMSPVLKAGEMSELKAAAVKGSGTLTFDVRVANPNLEGESPEAEEGAAKTVLTLLDGKAELLAWTNETDWTSASYTVEEAKATSHAFTWRIVQGADLGAHAYVANVVWSPAGTEMRALTLAAASYANGEPCDDPFAGGTVSGGGVYPDKTKLSLVATAKVGYEFIGWYDGETLFDAKAKSSATITNDLALTARFEKIPYIRGLADPADGGKVSGSGLCARGKKVTLKAAANKNYTFLGWVCGGRGATALPDDGDGRAGSPLPAADGEYVATTTTLMIDRSAKPAANSKTSTTITNVAEDVTYFAVFKSDPEIFVTVDATDGTGAEPTGKGAGKYVAGTITGMGKYAPGKTKIALKAAANKGYVFAGWYDASGELLTKEATYTIASMGENDVEYTAKFVTSEEDKAAITLEVNGEALDTQNAIPAWSNYCGVAVSWPVTSGGLSETKVKVSGLPSGLKFTDKPVTSKIGSGKSAVTVTNVPANTIYGAPTAASKTDKNTGLLTPAKVKFTVTTAGKSTETFTVDVVVLPLPDWAVGTFDGAVSEGNGEGGTGNGTVAITIAANGKISGKILESGKTWALTAASFSAVEGQLSDVDNLTFRATVIGTAGKEVATNEVTVTAGTRDACPYLSGVVSGWPASEPAGEPAWTACQNLWKRADTKAEQLVFKKSIDVTYFLGDPGDAANTVKLTFKKDGVVAFAGMVGGAKVSGSSQLVPRLAEDGSPYQVTLYAPAKGSFAGWCKTLDVALTLDAQNIVTGISIGGGDAPAGSGSWFTGEFNGYGDVQFPLVGGDTEFLNGLFSINVAANLSFTGTFFGTDGTNATFSGTFVKDGSSYVATGVSITVKGKTMSMGLMCDPGPYAGSDEGFGEIGGGSEDVQGEPCIALNCAWQNIWKRGDLAAEWKPAFAAGTEKTLDLQDTWLADLSVGDSLTYAFGADGAVSITGKIYGESVNATATLDLEGLDGSSGTMHCNFFFLANGHLYQQQFTFPRQATVTATDITLDSFVRID